jgi:hypothetical protein
MHRLPIGGRLKTALGVIAFAACAGGVAPAFAAEPPPTTTIPTPTPVYCYQTADQNNTGSRYLLTNGFRDWWLDLPGAPEGYYAFRYRTHVEHQNWNGDHFVTDGEWDGVWGGPTNYIPESDYDTYYTLNGVCMNVTGFGFGSRS